MNELTCIAFFIAAAFMLGRWSNRPKTYRVTPWERQEAARYSRDKRHQVSESMQGLWRECYQIGRAMRWN